MRPTRVLLAVSAAALVATACGDDSTTNAAAPSRAAGSATSAAPSTAAAGGVADLAAAEIFARSKAAFKKADTVRLKGSGAAGATKFAIDMRYATAGDAIGTVTNGGQTIELRRVGQTVYVKADKAFWTKNAGAALAQLLGGKYLKAPLNDPRVAQLGAFTDKNSFADEVLSPDNTVTKGDTKTIRGVPAIGVVDKAGSGSATLYVATTGEPVPLQLTPTSGNLGEGSFNFLDYGKPVDVGVPPAGQTIDTTKLGK